MSRYLCLLAFTAPRRLRRYKPHLKVRQGVEALRRQRQYEDQDGLSCMRVNTDFVARTATSEGFLSVTHVCSVEYNDNPPLTHTYTIQILKQHHRRRDQEHVS